jgi:hypothetical protein
VGEKRESLRRNTAVHKGSKSGYLSKQAITSMAKNWRRRFFVLNGKDRTLRYFADDTQAQEKGLFHLLPGSFINDSDRKPNCFELVTKCIGTGDRLDEFGRQGEGELSVFICAETAPEKAEWVQALEATISVSNLGTPSTSSTQIRKKSSTALDCLSEGCMNSHRYTDGYCHEHRALAAKARADKIANLLFETEEKKVAGEEDDEDEDEALSTVVEAGETGEKVKEFSTLSATRRNYGIKGEGGMFMEMLATEEARSQHQVQMLPNSKGVLTVKVFEDVDPSMAMAVQADMKLLGKLKLRDFTVNVPVDVSRL